jgi:hypothetical protein
VPLHAITYDLSKPGQKYTQLREKIEAFGNWCHAAESTWIVSSTLSDLQIRDLLTPVLDGNDKLIVTELTGSWASWGLDAERTDWLKKAA